MGYNVYRWKSICCLCFVGDAFGLEVDAAYTLSKDQVTCPCVGLDINPNRSHGAVQFLSLI